MGWHTVLVATVLTAPPSGFPPVPRTVSVEQPSSLRGVLLEMIPRSDVNALLAHPTVAALAKGPVDGVVSVRVRQGETTDSVDIELGRQWVSCRRTRERETISSRPWTCESVVLAKMTAPDAPSLRPFEVPSAPRSRRPRRPRPAPVEARPTPAPIPDAGSAQARLRLECTRRDGDDCRRVWHEAAAFGEETNQLLAVHDRQSEQAGRGLTDGPLDTPHLHNMMVEAGVEARGQELHKPVVTPVEVFLNNEPDRPRMFRQRPSEACLRHVVFGETSRVPPRLSCFHAVFVNERLDKSNVYKAFSIVSMYVPLPLWNSIMEYEVRSADARKTARVSWTHVWLGWARRQPDLVPPLRSLTIDERELVVRAVRRWWPAPTRGDATDGGAAARYAAHREVLSTIAFRHVSDLVPGCRQGDGLPDRRCFNSPLLFATNWADDAGQETMSRIDRRFRALDSQQQSEIRAAFGSTSRWLTTRQARRVASVIDGSAHVQFPSAAP